MNPIFTSSASSPSVLDKLFDTASGLFTKYVDFESFKFQTEMETDLAIAQRQAEQARAPESVSYSWSNPDGTAFPWDKLLLAGVVVAAGYVIVKNK